MELLKRLSVIYGAQFLNCKILHGGTPLQPSPNTYWGCESLQFETLIKVQIPFPPQKKKKRKRKTKDKVFTKGLCPRNQVKTKNKKNKKIKKKIFTAISSDHQALKSR